MRDSNIISDTLVTIYLLVLIAMSDWIDQLSFAQRQRLKFIETLLIWDDSVQRQDVCRVFDVTPNHLTRDIKRYRSNHPGALEYDVEARAYRKGRKFKPLFASDSADDYLLLLQTYSLSGAEGAQVALGRMTSAVALPQQAGGVSPRVLKAIMHALRSNTGVDISYQSFSDPEPSERTLWPHTLVFDGNRWHMRAFDSRRQEFRDFVLARCLSAKPLKSIAPRSKEDDVLWKEEENLVVIPSPRLSPSQQSVIAREYGMTNNGTGTPSWCVTLKKCLVGYFLSRYRLEQGGNTGTKPAAGQHPYLALKDVTLAKSYRFIEE